MGASVCGNEMLHGFEADLVLRCTSVKSRVGALITSTRKINGDKKPENATRSTEIVKVVNVELDGPCHQFATKRRFCGLRDEYLTRVHGVRVVRWDLMAPAVRDMSDEEVVRSLRDMMASMNTKGLAK